MTRRASTPATRRDRATAAKTAPKPIRRAARPRAVGPVVLSNPAITRARIFTQWMIAGALAGVILSLAQAQNAWVGSGITSNIIQAIGAGIATGLVARGACWIWLARQK